jgi:DNA primase
MAGLPNVLFNADFLRSDADHIIIVEGEKKSIVLAQTGLPNVGIMGKSGFQAAWVPKFARFRVVYVMLDPDAEQQAAEIARLFSGRGRVVSLPDKPDDIIVKHEATRDDLEWYLRRARPL